MKDNQSKKYIVLMAISVLCLIVIITAGSYAYFKPNIIGSGSNVQVSSGKVKLEISNAEVKVGEMAPILDSTKNTKAHKNAFTLSRTSDSTMDACYQLSLEIDNIGTNLRNKFFKYELEYDNKTLDGNFANITLDENGKASIPLLYNQTLNSNTTSHSYVLRLWLSYSETEDQTSLLTGEATTRSFTGRLKASGYTGACKISPEESKYTVTVTSNDTSMGIVTPTTQTVKSGSSASFTFNSIGSNRYSYNTCNSAGGIISGNTITFESVTSNINCKILFEDESGETPEVPVE